MTAQLTPISGGSIPSILISRPVILIGRHPECDVRIDSPKVSRRHCCLALAYDRLILRDLGSRNGVLVNGRPIDEEIQLRPGDEVAIAHYLYRLDGLDKPSSAPDPPVEKPVPSTGPFPAIMDLDDDFIPLD